MKIIHSESIDISEFTLMVRGYVDTLAKNDFALRILLEFFYKLFLKVTDRIGAKYDNSELTFNVLGYLKSTHEKQLEILELTVNDENL